MALALACLLAITSAVLGSSQGIGLESAEAAQGCPGGGSCLRVHLVDNGRETGIRYVSNAQLRAAPFQDLGTTEYRTREPGGRETNNPTLYGGVSIRSLATNLQRDPRSVSYVEIRNPADSRGYVSQLGGNDLREPGANGFENGLQPAFEGTGADELNYIRPLRAGDPNDTNNLDSLATGVGGLLDVVIGTGGERVRPVISATLNPVTVGEPATFRATVDRAGTYDYAWDFGEGGTASGTGPQHAFATTGTYLVSLRLSGDAYGQSNVLRVEVKGKAPPTPAPTTTPTNVPTTTPTDVPTEVPTDAPSDEDNPEGASDDPNAPVTGPNAGSDGQTGGAAPGPRVTDPGDPGQQANPTNADKGKPGRRTPGGDEVRGLLLAGGQVVPVGQDDTSTEAGPEPTAPTARAAALGGGGGGLWWGAGLLPVLLLLGAVGETGLLATLWRRVRMRP